MSSSEDQTTLPAGTPMPSRESRVSLAFRGLVKSVGLAMAMYEGFVERPVNIYVIGLALLLLSGSESVAAYVAKKAAT